MNLIILNLYFHRVKLSRDEFEDIDSFDLDPHYEILPDDKNDVDLDEVDLIEEMSDGNETFEDTVENIEDLVNRGAFRNHKRRSRKLIPFNPKRAAEMRKEKLKNDLGNNSSTVTMYNFNLAKIPLHCAMLIE